MPFLFVQTNNCERIPEVVIHLKPAPHQSLNNFVLLANNADCPDIHPDTIMHRFWNEIQGAGFKVQNIVMAFHYSDLARKRFQSIQTPAIMTGSSTLRPMPMPWKQANLITRHGKNNPDIPSQQFYESEIWGPVRSNNLFGELVRLNGISRIWKIQDRIDPFSNFQ